MSNCSKSNSPTPNPSPPVSTTEADWVIDGCRVTYKGHPVPLGHGPKEFEALFGSPSDSLVEPWAKHPPFRTYSWDNLGLKTEIWSDKHPDLFGGVQISFQQPYQSQETHTHPNVHGTSRIEFRPYGLLDSNSIGEVLRKAFHHSFALRSDNPSFLELDMGQGYWLSILPLRDLQGHYYGLGIHFNTPNSGNPMTYPEVFAKLDASCRMSEGNSRKGSTDSSKIEAQLRAGIDAMRALEQVGIDNIGKKLRDAVSDDSSLARLKSASESMSRHNGKKE